jgi:hypothetical protein
LEAVEDGRQVALDPPGIQALQGIVPEDAPDHGGALQGQPLLGRQAVQARRQHLGQGGRHAHLRQALPFDLPAGARFADHAFFDEHLDQLFDVEGVAFGMIRHPVQEKRGQVLDLLQDIGNQRAALLPGEGMQIQALVD